jgi:hypothetical protein
MSNSTVAIVGAGPYGLSIAAHLRTSGPDFRIFGTSMHRWRAQMPTGMFLKSELSGSNLFDPDESYTLQKHCSCAGFSSDIPISLETFTRYGLSFQQRLVPMVEDVSVTEIDKQMDAFQLRLASGEELTARNVVIATGLSHTAHIPSELAHLPLELLSHSSDHSDLGHFKGRDVVVIGGGQSALETAALLNEGQATVRLLVRRKSIEWNPHPKPGPRSLWERTRRPESALGNGLRTWFCAEAPNVFYHLPQGIRIEFVQNFLGPAGAYWLRERVLGRVPTLLGNWVRGAESRGDRVVLHVQGLDGNSREIITDHVIAASGYRFVVQALPFLSQALKRRLQPVPSLSSTFESCVPGLYFTGLASAHHFGSAMRFLYGARYTARCVSRAVASRGFGRRGVPNLRTRAPVRQLH